MNRPELRVVHVPFDARNPYQPALAEALRPLGVSVQGQILRWHLFRQARGADVLHVHWTFALAKAPRWKFALRYPALAAQLLAIRLTGRRIVWTMHNVENHERHNRVRDWLASALIGHCANRVIVHGQSAARAAFRRFAIRPGKVSVIPQGNYIGMYSDTVSRADARRKLNLPERTPVLLFFGNIRPYKGVEELIDAFRRIDADAALVIAGRPSPGGIEGRVRDLARLDPRLRFYPGFVDDDQVQVFMNAADVAVFPYRDITTSAAVMLAMSFAKACLAPRLGALTEMLDEGGAFLYDNNRSCALESALRQALSAGGRLEAMGRRNRARAEQWSWSHIASATAAVYRGGLP
jgi:glycosyltransferase involved in cell wall biosynthesis